ncbi:MAG: macro domain-containing protein, partial [Planctomycetes bacterium]|nr:macro domain-containing protein [Planctomycetota bacterium]
MIERVTGNLLEADAEALVNTVNCVGVMGKGIALQFRQAFPDNAKAYRRACKEGKVQPGSMLVYDAGPLVSPRYIINFPTKRHWKGKSRIEDVRDGLRDLVRTIRRLKVRSIAIPPLGCGNGGLAWEDVRPLIEKALTQVPGVRTRLYEPAGAPARAEMPVRTKRPAMTAGRAALLGIFRRYLIPGYQLTMLEVQKLA